MLELIVNYAWIFIQLVIGYNLILPLILFILYSCFKQPTSTVGEAPNEDDYAVVVTAFEYTEQLEDTVNSLVALNHDKYLIYVVADKCDINDLHFGDPRVILLKPELVLASNTRSHLYAINNFKRQHNRIAIIDSDNLVHPEFLTELEKWFKKGFNAVQGVRAAKNLDTTLACLDAARDIYYHFYDGQVLFRLGSSATLSGSGMAFTTDLYRYFLQNHDVVGAGFDKVLQFTLVKQNFRIAFAADAIVYDAKTSVSEQLINQRSRWIHTWFKYSKFGFTLLRHSLQSPNCNQFLFGLTLLRPPLFIFLILSLLFMIINFFINPGVALIWAVSIFCFLLSFAIAFKNSVVDPKIYKSLAGIPIFIFYQILSLMKIKTISKRPPTTRHNSGPVG